MRVISSMRYPWVVLAVLLVVSSGCSKGGKVPARSVEEAKTIKIEAVKTEAIRRNVEVVGTLAADDQVTISAEASGRVNRILADLGDRVVAGQVLVELDREKLRYNADEQNADLERALAKYGASTPDALPSIEQAPDVQKAAAELLQAKQSLDRAAELYKRQLVPQQLLDDADATYRAKQATYESAMQNAKNLRADIAASVASAKMADRQLRDASIRAPFGGYVERRLVSLGQLVNVQTPVMSVVRVDPLKVTAEIPEALAPWVKVAQRVTLFVDAYPDKPFTATVSRISPSVSPQSRAFAFEALVPNPGNDLKPGTFARVRLESSRVDRVLTLPFSAMQYRYGVNRVFVVQAGRLSARELKVGERAGERVEILGGVQAGDAVALTDVDQLADGQRVTGPLNSTTGFMLAELRPPAGVRDHGDAVVLDLPFARSAWICSQPDPATVNVALSCPARAPMNGQFGCRAGRRSAQQRVLNRRALLRPHHRRQRNVTVKFVLERDINDAANASGRRWPVRWAASLPSCCRR